MIVLPAARKPPALVVSPNVAAAEVLPATRSDAATTNDTLVTCPPIAPEPTPGDAMGSELVVTEMPLELPLVAAPMVKPIKVTVTEEFPFIA